MTPFRLFLVKDEKDILTGLNQILSKFEDLENKVSVYENV